MNLWMATKVKIEDVDETDALAKQWNAGLGTKKAAPSLPKLKEMLVEKELYIGNWDVKRIDIGKGNLETACKLLMRSGFIKSTLEKMVLVVQEGEDGLVAKKKRGT